MANIKETHTNTKEVAVCFPGGQEVGRHAICYMLRFYAPKLVGRLYRPTSSPDQNTKQTEVTATDVVFLCMSSYQKPTGNSIVS